VVNVKKAETGCLSLFFFAIFCSYIILSPWEEFLKRYRLLRVVMSYAMLNDNICLCGFFALIPEFVGETCWKRDAFLFISHRHYDKLVTAYCGPRYQTF
jgi:hypothetical protein